MIYCVIKNTATVIDSSPNTEENMLLAALSAGFEKDEVEFIDEVEFNQRKENEPKLLPLPTTGERLEALEMVLLELL